MATIFLEGGDKYGPPATTLATASLVALDISSLLTANEWTVAVNAGAPGGGVISSFPGLSETGNAIGLISSFGPWLAKTLPASYGRLIGGFRFSTNLLAQAGVTFYDSLNPQVAVIVEQASGLFTVYGGTAATGAILARSVASISANTIHYVEFDITFSSPSGSYQVWLDGVSIISGTGITQQLGCNPSANIFQLWTAGPGAGNPSEIAIYDDIYLFDNTTAQNNAPLLSNPRIETQFPFADHQKQFTQVNNIFGVAFSAVGQAFGGGEDAPGANELFLRKFTPNVSCTVNSISLIPGQNGASPTANFKAVIYSNSSGVPGSLLSSGTQVTGSLALVPLIGPLTTPQALAAGTPYWIGFITDTSVFLANENANGILGFKAANTYGSGAPSMAPAMTPAQHSWVLWGNCTGAATNWQSEAVNPAPGDISSISSSTAGNEDLYQFPALSTDITTVFSVGVKANAKVVAAGSRTIDLRTLSSATDSGGSHTGQTPQTSYGWFDSYFDLDPNGAITWTPAAVTASFSGPKVAS